ncbi:MAG: hypothetical protein ABI678_14910, partial [Kofleriaceae bacterium]
DALACVAAEHPPAYAAMTAALGARRFDLEIEDEAFMIDLGTPPEASVVSITTDLATLEAVIEGELATLDAILADRIEIYASTDDLVAVAEAIKHFMQGALRCISMPAVLDRLVTLRKDRGE